MARLNVYVTDELARRAREAGLNVSRLTQRAIEDELRTADQRKWIDRMRTSPPLGEVSEELVRRTLDEVKDEFGGWPGG